MVVNTAYGDADAAGWVKIRSLTARAEEKSTAARMTVFEDTKTKITAKIETQRRLEESGEERARVRARSGIAGGWRRKDAFWVVARGGQYRRPTCEYARSASEDVKVTQAGRSTVDRERGGAYSREEQGERRGCSDAKKLAPDGGQGKNRARSRESEDQHKEHEQAHYGWD